MLLTSKDRELVRKAFPNLKVTDLILSSEAIDHSEVTPKKEKALAMTPPTQSTSVKRLSRRLTISNQNIYQKVDHSLFQGPSNFQIASRKSRAVKKLEMFLKSKANLDDERRLPKRAAGMSKVSNVFQPSSMDLRPKDSSLFKRNSLTWHSMKVRPVEKLQAKRDEMHRRKLSCKREGDSTFDC